MKRLPRKPNKPDPYFQDVPQEIIFDDRGRVLAEIFMPPLKYLNDGLVRRKDKAK